jgi:hypothetical protein
MAEESKATKAMLGAGKRFDNNAAGQLLPTTNSMVAAILGTFTAGFIMLGDRLDRIIELLEERNG